MLILAQKTPLLEMGLLKTSVKHLLQTSLFHIIMSMKILGLVKLDIKEKPNN